MIKSYDESLREFTKQYLTSLFILTRGNATEAARIAKRNRSEFYRLMKRVNFDPKPYRKLPPPTEFTPTEITIKVGESLESVEMRMIQATLGLIGQKTLTAEILGISLKTLYNKLQLETPVEEETGDITEQDGTAAYKQEMEKQPLQDDIEVVR